jgi:hypothetical protein
MASLTIIAYISTRTLQLLVCVWIYFVSRNIIFLPALDGGEHLCFFYFGMPAPMCLEMDSLRAEFPWSLWTGHLLRKDQVRVTPLNVSGRIVPQMAGNKPLMVG